MATYLSLFQKVKIILLNPDFAIGSKICVQVGIKKTATLEKIAVNCLMEDQVVITSANVDHKKGHGLGYLIIKDLLKTMAATLHIESEKGEGTTVSISMKG